jgi:predicted nucleic acid-binding Zn ribbon protein
MERLGDDASRLLAAAGAPRVDALAAVVDAWPGAVGDAVARNAWPQRVARDGTLHVATTSSAWAFELGRLAPQMLEGLRRSLGPATPVALRFAPGPVPEPATQPPATRPGRSSPGAEHRRAGTGLAAAIDDPELRELVARAAAASLARAAADHSIW